MKMAAMALAMIAAQAGEAQWTHIQRGESGSNTYYDAGSVRRDGNRVRVDLRAVPGPDSTTGVRVFQSEEELDCAGRTATTLTLVADMRDGSRLDVPPDGAADPINPGTALATLYEILCTAGETI